MNHSANSLLAARSGKSRNWIVGVLLLALFSAGDCVWSQTWTGAGSDANWSTAGNWDTGVPVGSTTTVLTFSGSTQPVSTLDSAMSGGLGVMTVSNLVMNMNTSATLSGGTIYVYGPNNPNTNTLFFNKANQTINNNIVMLKAAAFYGGAANGTINGNIDLNGQGVGFKAGYTNQDITVNGAISGSGAATGVIFSGYPTGKVYLNGNNSFTSNISLWNTTVMVGSNTSFGNNANVVSLGAGTGQTTVPSLLTNGAYTVNQNIRLTSEANSVAYTVGGATANSSTYAGNIIVSSSSAGSAAREVTLTATNGGRVNVTGNIQRDSTAGVTTGNLDNVLKTGTGVVALSGTGNNYSGTTTVSAGVLLVNGDLNGGGAGVQVASLATLGGKGAINRNVTVADGGVLSAGDMNLAGVSQGGLLSITGDLILGNASVLNFDLGGATDDFISITGNLTLDGLLNVTNLGGLSAGTYHLLSYTGTFTDSGLVISNMPSGFTYSIDLSTPSQVNLTVVPEPAAVGMILGGLALLVVLGAKRKHQEA